MIRDVEPAKAPGFIDQADSFLDGAMTILCYRMEQGPQKSPDDWGGAMLLGTTAVALYGDALTVAVLGKQNMDRGCDEWGEQRIVGYTLVAGALREIEEPGDLAWEMFWRQLMRYYSDGLAALPSDWSAEKTASFLSGVRQFGNVMRAHVKAAVG